MNGTADALWRAAFGLLAATVLRDDLASAEVPARAVRQAVTRAKISRKEIGARVGPYAGRGVGGDASRDVTGGAQSELVVLLAGEVYDETEGALVGPCVLAPDPVAAARVFGGDSSRAAAFGKLAQCVEAVIAAGGGICREAGSGDFVPRSLGIAHPLITIEP